MGTGFSPYGREGPLDFCPFEIPFLRQQNRIRELMLKGFEPREAAQGVLLSRKPDVHGPTMADGPSNSVWRATLSILRLFIFPHRPG